MTGSMAARRLNSAFDQRRHDFPRVAKCVVCLQTMDEWDSTEIRVYKLIQRSEDA